MLLPRAHKGTQLCGGQLLVCQGPPDGVTKVLEMGKSRRKNIRSYLDYEIILLVSSTCIFFISSTFLISLINCKYIVLSTGEKVFTCIELGQINSRNKICLEQTIFNQLCQLLYVCLKIYT